MIAVVKKDSIDSSPKLAIKFSLYMSQIYCFEQISAHARIADPLHGSEPSFYQASSSPWRGLNSIWEFHAPCGGADFAFPPEAVFICLQLLGFSSCTMKH
jgi:hypothetical protein